MKWAIQCADANTGQEFSLIVDADSQADAEAQARKKGLLVSEIIAAGEPATPSDEAPKTVSYAVDRFLVPEYTGLRRAAFAFRIVAYLWYAFGAIQIILRIWQELSIRSTFSTNLSNLWETVSENVYFLTFIAIGVVFHACAPVCLALRDIARNSFRAET
jgi:hypothetical protein